MNFNLNSYLKQLDSMFQKTKKNIESRIKKRQAGEEDLGITRTKLNALKYELSRMEQNMRKHTEKEFKGLKESMAASNMLKSKNMSDVAQVVLKGNSSKIKKYLNRMTSPKMNNALKAIKKADPKLHSQIVEDEVEQVDEISKSTMSSYLKKSSSSLRDTSYNMGANRSEYSGKDHKKSFRKIANRQKGIERVSSRLSKKEEVKIDEDEVKKAAAKLRLARKLKSQKKVADRLKARVDRIKVEKTMKSGDKLSGKKEPIDLQPELKTDNR